MLSGQSDFVLIVKIDVVEQVRTLVKQLRDMLATRGEHRYLREIDAALASPRTNFGWSWFDR